MSRGLNGLLTKSFDGGGLLDDHPVHPNQWAQLWAERAELGCGIDATARGSRFTVPVPTHSEFLLFGDTASLPARSRNRWRPTRPLPLQC